LSCPYADWKRVDNATGHCTYKNQVTGITISFQGHVGGRSDPTIKKHIADKILDDVQLHMNILCNVIFCYIHQNWRQAPANYNSCLLRYNAWVDDGKPLDATKEEKTLSA